VIFRIDPRSTDAIMGKVKLSKWDSVEYLKTDEDMALYL